MDTEMTDTGRLPTPPASSAASSQHPSLFPRPRRQPLKAGGTKESELIIYLDRGLNRVQKDVDNRMKKGQSENRSSDTRGYTSFSDASKELDGLIDVIWVSGTLKLQVPYLLTIARMITEFIPLFPSSPRETFRIVEKLDAAFSGLLTGHDAHSGEPLPGFEDGRRISTTDKVRIKGIVERTRLVVAGAFKGAARAEEDDTTDTEAGQTTEYESMSEDNGNYVKFEGFETNDEEEDSGEDDEEEEEEGGQAWEERHVGAVYQRTIGELGDVLGGPPIGIITDN